MTSHEYAQQVMKTAEHLLARPDVDLGSTEPYLFARFHDKDKFVAAAKAMGSGQKKYTDYDDIHFIPNGTCLHLSIPKNRVCRKVQDVKWECEPFLSETEHAELEATA